EKTAKVNEEVNLTYSFIDKEGRISNEEFYVCIDIPVQLKLIGFKINGVERDSGIQSLGSKYNRIYLPVKYDGPIVVDYTLKVLDTLPEGKKLAISHAIRDAKTGKHVNVEWMKAYVTRFDRILDGTGEDNNTVEALPQTGGVGTMDLLLTGVIALIGGITLKRKK
ncbi:MAG: LPXTG cell wall anchor domain-containing protein, partial [Clostridium sp.]